MHYERKIGDKNKIPLMKIEERDKHIKTFRTQTIQSLTFLNGNRGQYNEEEDYNEE